MSVTPKHKRLEYVNFKILRYMVTNSNMQDLKINNKIDEKEDNIFLRMYICQTALDNFCERTICTNQVEEVFHAHLCSNIYWRIGIISY